MSIQIETRQCEGPNNQTRLEIPVEITANTAMHQINCPFLATYQFQPSDAIVELCTVPTKASSLLENTNPLLLPPCRFSPWALIQPNTPGKEYCLEPVFDQLPPATVVQSPQYPQ